MLINKSNHNYSKSTFNNLSISYSGGRLPYDETQARNNGVIFTFTVIAIDTYDLFTLLEIDVGERAIATLRSNALYTTLILVKVDIADHVVRLDTTSDIVHTVVSIFVVVERLCIENIWRLLLIKLSSEEGT